LACVPLVAGDSEALLSQAAVARSLDPDVVEWRADSYNDLSPESVSEAARLLRGVLDSEPIIFTLRAREEGGAKQLAQDVRSRVISAVLRSALIDIVDVELCNGGEFIEPVRALAREVGARVILSFHDFESTPSAEVLLGKISEMVHEGADIAKVACMPREPGDVLRLLEVTLAARQMFPAVPLVTMSMGSLGVITRVAGFLFGSDLSFAAAKAISAPGQIPIGEMRALTEALLRHA
jgi:3-dehydroquinate dehydratase-1